MKNYLFVFNLLTFCLFSFVACDQQDELCELDPPNQDFACITVYEPVCGCDGKTYSNDCFASLAGVPSTIPGECP